MYLDYAENQAERGRIMKMADWVDKLNGFLQFNEMEILQNPGRVSAATAKRLAEKEFKSFVITQDRSFESDFDKQAKRLESKSDKAGKNK